MELVFATNNAHKLEEVRTILGDKMNVISLKDIQYFTEIPETCETIAGNALQKARTVFDHTGFACFADDTGLEIASLDGKPGVNTAHYAGPARDNHENMHKVLKELVFHTDRTARFVTVIAFVSPVGEYVFEGEVKGEIAKEMKGEGGFGYDPIFIPEGHKQTFAQLDASIKNEISHRARAIQLFTRHLSDMNLI
jgi:XTP/dITP diphosphohydrolase